MNASHALTVPAAPAAFRDLSRALARGGAAVLFSSHVTETVERLCDRVVPLREGCVVRELSRDDWGAPAEEHSLLERAFLDAIRTGTPS